MFNHTKLIKSLPIFLSGFNPNEPPLSKTQRTLLHRYLQTMRLLRRAVHRWRSAKPPTKENQPITPSPPLHHTSTQPKPADRASQHVPTGAYPEPCIETKAGGQPIMGETLPPSTPKPLLCATPPKSDPLLPLVWFVLYFRLYREFKTITL